MTTHQNNSTEPRKLFNEAMTELKNCNHQFFVEKSIKPVEHGNRRGAAIAKALFFMALEHGVKLKEPLQIDSQGEFSIVVAPPTPLDYGRYGEPFAQWLNKHNPRCGLVPGATLLAENNWCRMNHFEVEKMVIAYHQQLQNT